MTELTLPQHKGRVRLRRLRGDDLPRFQAYRSNADVARFQGWTAMSDAEAAGFLQAMQTAELLRPGHWTQLGIADRHSGALLGDIGVHITKDSTEAELGITLGADAQGQGKGFDAALLACEWLWGLKSLTRIEAITHADNAAALALLSHLPFVHVRDTQEIVDGVPTPERWFEWRRS